MVKSNFLKIGTRKSLLAQTQSQWVASQIEKIHPHVRVELVGIETRGDQIIDIPLREVQGKDFFVAELDRALLERKVDIAVHSFKDLSLERPKEIFCAAIPAREDPRDIILFSPKALKKISNGEKITVGTSAPRRIENIPSFLKSALPQSKNKNRSSVEMIEIRGNVNTRLSRLHEVGDRYLDATVLALAGLNRLSKDSKSLETISLLLEDLKWMIPPLSLCPSAPGQGALSVECRQSDQATKEILSGLHSKEAHHEIMFERELLKKYGGGCHQRFGATCFSHPELGRLRFLKGKSSEGTPLEDLHWSAPQPPAELPTEQLIWDGSQHSATKKVLQVPFGELKNKSIFIAHSRAAANLDLQDSHLWTSGFSSWSRLADQGYWVEGCAEGLGFQHLLPTLQSAFLKALGLPEIQNWTVLTHSEGINSWAHEKIDDVIATYSVQLDYSKETKEKLKSAKFLYWSSGSQYATLKEYTSPHAHHACGPGKTSRFLRQAGVKNLGVFPNTQEWRKWLKLA